MRESEKQSERVTIDTPIYTRRKPVCLERRASDTRNTLFEMLLGSFRSSQQRVGDAAPRRSMCNPPAPCGGMHARAAGENQQSESGNVGQQAAPKR